MPRIARHVFPGVPYHITQRGNRQCDVFFSDHDRWLYLGWLGEYAALYGLDILAYCLMTNHVHAVGVPEGEQTLEQVFRPLNTRYAMHVNRARGWTGHLWQGRYFAAPLDEAYLRAAVRYVELNPVRAGMVRSADRYPWSSATAHCALRSDPLLAHVGDWIPEIEPGPAWAAWLAQGDRPGHLEALRHSVQRDLPCGSDGFVRELERRSGTTMRPGRPGRPRSPD